MLKLTLLIFSVVFFRSSAYLIKVPTSAWKPQTVLAPVREREEWVNIHNQMLPLFDNVCEESTDSVIIKNSNDFEKDFGNGDYWDSEVIAKFENYKNSKGFLAKGEIFSELQEDHINELKLIFNILYYAKNFATFYKAAAWARQNINCGLYVDAIYLAILHRRDTEKLSIPPPYEILPNYMVNKDAVIKASLLLANSTIMEFKDIREQGNTYIIDACYSSGCDNNLEQSLEYFQEDVGLNSYYFTQKLKTASWLNTSMNLEPKYGQCIYHMMKQLTTRYDLERYSNNLPELGAIDWSADTINTYNPMLIYSNGDDFGKSYLNTFSEGNENLITLRNIENSILNISTQMWKEGYSKEEILNQLTEILVTNYNSYENLAFKQLSDLKQDFDAAKSSPSVLAHYLTTVREPMFWKINKKIVNLIDSALAVLPAYEGNDLIFPGVEIVNMDVKKMVTTFDSFDFDVTNALKTTTTNTKFSAKIGQYRLNHKPFSIKLNISSLVTQKGYAKIFIGPKVLPGEFSNMNKLFFLLDSFEIYLKRGKNTITRSSEGMKLSKDFTSLKIIKKQLDDAQFGLNSLSLETIDEQIRFPQRLLIPKGSEDGLTFQIFVLLCPYVKPSLGGRNTNIEYNLDALFNPGFPFDLKIDMQQLLELPNTIVKDVIITHKFVTNEPKETEYETPGANSLWTDDEIGRPVRQLKMSDRPDFTKKREPFDYKSKKGGKKEDYSAKRGGYSKGQNVITPTTSPETKTDIIINKSEKDVEIEIKKDENSALSHNTVYQIITDTVDSEKNNTLLEIDTIKGSTLDTNVKLMVADNVLPILPENRNPTVYDFLFTDPYYAYNKSDEEVYE